METEKIVMFVSGIVLLIISFSALFYGMSLKVCSIDDFCPLALVIVIEITIGVMFMSKGLEDSPKKENAPT